MQQKARFHIKGMTCQACASRIEKVLNKKEFIQSASVNFASEEAQISFDNSQAAITDLIKIIEKTGFGAIEQSISPSLDTATEASNSIHWRLWLLFIITLPFLIGMIGMFGNHHNWMISPFVQFVLASVVQLWLAIPFYKSAYASIKGGLANMDVLVSIGTVSIYLYSVYMLFFHQNNGHNTAMPNIYFEAAVMVIAFVSLGKFLEHQTKKTSLNSLNLLFELTPTQVNALREDKWQILPLNQIKIGDFIRANHGERIAADGIVESGEAWTDESHLSGESIPQVKEMGSKVLAGSLINEGSIIYRATQLGQDTFLGDMINALSEAQGSKAPIARIADKVAAFFVPIVVCIACFTFFITWLLTKQWETGLIHAVSVLVIACPCALGLATPAAIMAGMGQAAKHGIWFKDAASMETSAHVDTVILDKTGTLTEGNPKIVASYCVNNSRFNEGDLYQIAAVVEQYASHPLAKSIVTAASMYPLTIPQANNPKTQVGLGISAEVDGIGFVKVGKPDYADLVLPNNLDSIWEIASIVAVSVNHQCIGAFALADTLKSDSIEAIGRLKANNIDVYIMSGDNQNTVDYIAAQLNITHAYGNMSPRDKAAQIEQFKNSGKTVAMVGDGINDAPALAAAHVSFAMKGGADIAEHTASATLMQHSINQLVDALLISQSTLKNIKQNLFFAFFYNILGIPLAACGFLNPIIAGAAMAASSISVLGNALRLKHKNFNQYFDSKA